MAFPTEPTSYEKTALSDLQGAWISLREAVVGVYGFPDSEKLLFHIDEAMSWESVRNLGRIKSTFIIGSKCYLAVRCARRNRGVLGGRKGKSGGSVFSHEGR